MGKLIFDARFVVELSMASKPRSPHRSNRSRLPSHNKGALSPPNKPTSPKTSPTKRNLSWKTNHNIHPLSPQPSEHSPHSSALLKRLVDETFEEVNGAYQVVLGGKSVSEKLLEFEWGHSKYSLLLLFLLLKQSLKQYKNSPTNS